MKIVIRTEEKGNWEVLDSVGYLSESELQELLVGSPSLIPMAELDEAVPALRAAVREFGLPGSGSTDLLAFSATGDIAIVECKLAANPESKRKVIGQILEYAAYLWGMGYEELDRRVQARVGTNLADLVASGLTEPDWDEEAFRQNLTANLKSGSFALIVAVDEINEELARTIRFLNHCGNAAYSLHALEMRRFACAGLDILVPHLHGTTEQRAPAAGKRRTRTWTREDFFAQAQAEVSGKEAEVMADLYEWSRTHADRVAFGTGVQTGSFTHYFRVRPKHVAAFYVYSNGTLQLGYGSLSEYLGPELVQSFHEALVQLEPFQDVSADLSKYPSVRLADAFVDRPEVLERFKRAVLELGSQISSS